MDGNEYPLVLGKLIIIEEYHTSACKHVFDFVLDACWAGSRMAFLPLRLVIIKYCRVEGFFDGSVYPMERGFS
jgi:hypothetical protein